MDDHSPLRTIKRQKDDPDYRKTMDENFRQQELNEESIYREERNR